MRTAVTLAAAVVLSLTLLTALEWSATRPPLPAGEVTIIQLDEPAAPLAQAEVDSQVVRTASSL